MILADFHQGNWVWKSYPTASITIETCLKWFLHNQIAYLRGRQASYLPKLHILLFSVFLHCRIFSVLNVHWWVSRSSLLPWATGSRTAHEKCRDWRRLFLTEGNFPTMKIRKFTRAQDLLSSWSYPRIESRISWLRNKIHLSISSEGRFWKKGKTARE